jgi:predicted DNA-binding transcriptional regulator AlpA
MEQLITQKQVIDLVGLSRMTLYRYRREGIFPAPAKLRNGGLRWRASAVQAWIAAL